MATEISPVDLHLGGKLREARTFRYMSQEELAGSVGLTYQQIQKYEVGKNRISAAMLYRFSLILQIKPLWFFEGLGEPKEGEPVPAVDAEQRRLLDAFDRIPSDPVRRTLIGFVRHLGDSLITKTGPSEAGVVVVLNRAADTAA